MRRSTRAAAVVKDAVVTETELQRDYQGVIARVNGLPGPEVAWDSDRQCFGLRARERYKRGQVITRYGGRRSLSPIGGDYVARCSELHVDGRVDFRLSEKGRWINESCRDRRVVNALLGREVRAACPIEAGEWIFTDYGDEYVRSY